MAKYHNRLASGLTLIRKGLVVVIFVLGGKVRLSLLILLDVFLGFEQHGIDFVENGRDALFFAVSAALFRRQQTARRVSEDKRAKGGEMRKRGMGGKGEKRRISISLEE